MKSVNFKNKFIHKKLQIKTFYKKYTILEKSGYHFDFHFSKIFISILSEIFFIVTSDLNLILVSLVDAIYQRWPT